MRYLIIDDDHIARAHMKNLLENVESHVVIAEAEDAVSAQQAIDRFSPEIVLADIRLPGVDGIEFAQSLRNTSNPPAVIFTTAYEKYAVDAFEVNAIDYLVKPIEPKRLQKAIQRAKKLTTNTATSENGSAPANGHIPITSKGKIKLLPISRICYFKAENKYVIVKTVENEYLINETLNNLEEQCQDHFIRVHRNALISKQFVEGLEKIDNSQWLVTFNKIDDKIEISRRQTPLVRRWLRNKPLV